MNTLSRGDELLRRIGTLKRVIKMITQAELHIVREEMIADINTLEAMIIEMGGQVRDVPYSKSKLRRLDTQLGKDMKVQLLDPDLVQDAIQHRDVSEIRTDRVKSGPIMGKRHEKSNDSD